MFPEWEYEKYFSVPEECFGPIREGHEIIDLFPDYLQDLSHFKRYSDRISRMLKNSNEFAFRASLLPNLSDVSSKEKMDARSR
jgi:hypothetical protein